MNSQFGTYERYTDTAEHYTDTAVHYTDTACTNSVHFSSPKLVRTIRWIRKTPRWERQTEAPPNIGF
jgi:hypothetical protein